MATNCRASWYSGASCAVIRRRQAAANRKRIARRSPGGVVNAGLACTCRRRAAFFAVEAMRSRCGSVPGRGSSPSVTETASSRLLAGSPIRSRIDLVAVGLGPLQLRGHPTSPSSPVWRTRKSCTSFPAIGFAEVSRGFAHGVHGIAPSTFCKGSPVCAGNIIVQPSAPSPGDAASRTGERRGQ